ncbi:MAG: outer membrane beta-barrel protein, partial [Candidatus Adiutrix sp.]|jgi:opacity protein-like surface antigen|nr:outer membrane beta-barrel protein [Candidatus Adiutrix sp.]
VPGGSQDDTSFGLGVAVGSDLSYSTAYPIRVEAEYLYHGKQSFNNGPHLVDGRLVSQTYDVSAHSLMANGFFDISTATAFTPYVGGGLGLAYVKSDFNSIFSNGDRVSVTNDSGKWNFAWNIGGGVAWSLNETMALDLGYRYMDLGRGDSGDFTVGGHSGQASVDLTAHEFGLGLRFTGF